MNVGNSSPCPRISSTWASWRARPRSWLRVILVRRASLHPRGVGQPLPGLGGRRDPGDVLALRRPLRRARAGVRGHEPHEARHGHRARPRAASPPLAKEVSTLICSAVGGSCRHRAGWLREERRSWAGTSTTAGRDARVDIGHERAVDQAGGRLPRPLLRLPARSPTPSRPKPHPPGAPGRSGERCSSAWRPGATAGFPTGSRPSSSRAPGDARPARPGRRTRSRRDHDLRARPARRPRPHQAAVRRGGPSGIGAPHGQDGSEMAAEWRDRRACCAETVVTRTPPFRADQAGSLLRPPELREARARARAGALVPGSLRAGRSLYSTVVARQKSLGLRVVTDGEFGRDWHLDFPGSSTAWGWRRSLA